MVQAGSSAHDGVPAASLPIDAGAARAQPSIAFGILALVLVVGLTIGWLTPGYRGDLNENKSWSRIIVRNGLHEAYRNNIDYAPVPLYVFGAIGWLYQALVDPAWNESVARESQTLTFMMKAPMIVSHVAITGVIFILGAATSQRIGALAALAYGLNPATLYDIAHFGQADALVGLAASLCLAAVFRGHGVLAGSVRGHAPAHQASGLDRAAHRRAGHVVALASTTGSRGADIVCAHHRGAGESLVGDRAGAPFLALPGEP